MDDSEYSYSYSDDPDSIPMVSSSRSNNAPVRSVVAAEMLVAPPREETRGRKLMRSIQGFFTGDNDDNDALDATQNDFEQREFEVCGLLSEFCVVFS